MKTRISTSFPQSDCGRDIALRCPRTRISGRNERVGSFDCAAGRGADGAAHRPYLLQRGVALVITLILLAVITTLAIAFLALTYRETAGVDSLARTTDSEMACESALERAKAEILAPFARNDTNRFSWATNGIETMGPDFMVSVGWHTNRVDDPATPANELTNLFLNPTPPVFVNTNRPGGPPPGPPGQPPFDFEDRFYLDLNRNHYFEDSGWLRDIEVGRFGTNEINWRVGDPQWIGVLQDPRRPHGPDNRFIYRYAFLVQPIGRSLDVNWIHNQALGGNNMLAGFNGFYRNQGVGTWELNLAGFLADLNANYWGNRPRNDYDFDPFNPAFPNAVASGAAFNDARDFLRYRYTPQSWNFFAPLASPHLSNDTFFALAPSASPSFASDYVDGYADGPLAPSNGVPPEDDNTLRPWPGADSRRHYFSVHDFFDGNKLPEPTGFTNKLANASLQGNSYDRYTYYRMLAQMGTDSAEEEEGKININYMNIRSWVNPNIRLLASDAIPWSTNSEIVQVPRLGGAVNMGRMGPELFFLSVVTNLLLREADLAFIVTNPPPPGIWLTPLRIPIFTNRAFGGARSTVTTNLPLPGPLYAGRIHQILQLAANIHDATTGSKQGEPFPYFPSIFRPRFQTAANGDVYIIDYALVTENYTVFRNNTDALWRDLDSGDTVASTNDLVYGIPLIIGARKGFPNFNEIAVLTAATATRKLTVFRTVSNQPPNRIDQDFTLNVRTKLQIEARNAWATPYPRPLLLQVGLNVGLQASNSTVRFPYRNWAIGTNFMYAANQWPGETLDGGPEQKTSFVLTPVFETNILHWHTNTPPDLGNVTNFWSTTLTNRMLFYIVDTAYDRIVDFVTLSRPHNHFEIGKLMAEDLPVSDNTLKRIWSNIRDTGMSLGVTNQLSISQNASVPEGYWGNYDLRTARTKDDAALNFKTFMQDNTRVEAVQAAFTPTRTMVQANYFQVGDPLVHHTFEDLRHAPEADLRLYETVSPGLVRTNLSDQSLGSHCVTARTWSRGQFGTADGTTSVPGEGLLDPRLRDPGLIHPDNWDFPTTPFANVGWLGRVHRGTPWQSIYLKSRPPASATAWKEHSGNQRDEKSSNLMVPTRDWELLDIFTTAPHPNATRGRLSINQKNLAAWSAVLAGAVTSEPIPDPDTPGFSKLTNAVMTPAAIDPAADPAIERIVEGINHQREIVSTNRYKYPNGEGYPFAPFNKLSDLMSTPELSEGSPYLNVDVNLFNGYQPASTAIITDADYERIPQQILSLVKLGEPRFVVYAWGQSLKPARRNPEDTGPSIVTSGPDRGLCRNYQITGEMATRAVIRVEFDRITDPYSPQFNQLDYSRPRAVVESFNLLPVE